jgi:hypothetical protein
MKKILAITCFIFIIPLALFAQKPQTIEQELLSDFKKIDDHPDTANDVFAKKLKAYTSKYPATIAYPFSLLSKARLDISSSDDGLFRIYSWDTQGGGTMHFFENVFQFKYGAKTNSILDTPKSEGDNCPNYNKLYTFKANNKTYYLAVSLSIGSTKDVGQAIRIFAIEDGKLNQDVKLIKTATGMHSQLRINYDFFSVVDWKVRPTIYFDKATQTICLPLVNEKGKVTRQLISYKFTGQYFEKVKS